ncbi:MAG: hypothetical protein ACD_56C00004G0006 [uncultured bacterium]|nr:MAG: hypothetical protein ACD_56C00004G0006 [uncultured bacterium]
MIDTLLKPIKFLSKFNPLKSKVEIKCEDDKCVLVVDEELTKDNSRLDEKSIEDTVLLVEDMYTPLSVAKEEIWRRWDEQDLKVKVELFLKYDIPEIFCDKPKAVIFRNIATPNLELQIAQEYAFLLGLDLVVIEYTIDKFCTRNRDKLHLVKMMFFNDKCKSQVVAKENIISIKEQDNKCFRDIDTMWGENLVSFHHRIFKKFGYENVEFFDASIFKERGLGPYEIYLEILGLCVKNAVLLENFLIKADKGEAKFTEQIIIPAFAEVMNKTGYNPLIIPLLGCDGEGNICWQYYADKIRDDICK